MPPARRAQRTSNADSSDGMSDFIEDDHDDEDGDYRPRDDVEDDSCEQDLSDDGSDATESEGEPLGEEASADGVNAPDDGIDVRNILPEGSRRSRRATGKRLIDEMYEDAAVQQLMLEGVGEEELEKALVDEDWSEEDDDDEDEEEEEDEEDEEDEEEEEEEEEDERQEENNKEQKTEKEKEQKKVVSKGDEEKRSVGQGCAATAPKVPTEQGGGSGKIRKPAKSARVVKTQG